LGFEKFGRFGYVSQTKIALLVSYLEKNQIMATKCKKCGTVYFPPRADCPKCRESEITWVPIEGKGRLVTFTEVYFAPPAFQDSAPYLLGLAELKDGLRVFAPISHQVDRKSLKPGLGLVLKVKQAGEGVYYQLEPESPEENG
jgi:uncharacterized OB-fold protein